MGVCVRRPMFRTLNPKPYTLNPNKAENARWGGETERFDVEDSLPSLSLRAKTLPPCCYLDVGLLVAYATFGLTKYSGSLT